MVYINFKSDLSNAVAIEKKLIKESKNHGLHPAKGVQFNMSQKEEEEIEILFEGQFQTSNCISIINYSGNDLYLNHKFGV